MRGSVIVLTVSSWLAVGGGLAGAQPSEGTGDVPAVDLAGESAAGAEETQPAAGAGETPSSAPAGTDAATGQKKSDGGRPAAGAREGAPASAAATDTAAAKAKPEEGVCNPMIDTCLVAETQGREKGHVWARGFTDLRMGDLRVQAEKLDIYDVEHDGVTTQHLTAEGGVVLLHRQDRLVGTTLSMDLDSGRGTMVDVVGYSDPGVYFTARQVERIDPKTYRISGGRFTTCCQPQPRWSFWAPLATLKVEDHITAVAAHFDLGVPQTGQQLPLFFMPYFYYPVKPDGRATGFLMPSFNIDFNRGVDIRLGFFLAMGRSADQTFGFERRASPEPLPGQPAGTISPKLSHDLRWVSGPRSYGDLHTALFPPSTAAPVNGIAANKSWDYSLDWNAQAGIAGLFQAKVLANVTSPQDILTSVAQYYNSNSRIALTLQRTFGRQFFQLQVDNRKSTLDQYQSTTRRLLPRFTLSQMPRGIGKTGIRWEYTVRADHITVVKQMADYDAAGTTETGSHTISPTWWRVDVMPSVSRPLATSFLSVTPKLTARYTYYTASCPRDNLDCGVKGLVDDRLRHRYAEASVDISGPKFSRVFSGPSGYSDLIKHVIVPEVVYVYRQATDDFLRIPRFGDDADNTATTHEIRYGITQELWGRKKLPNGGTRPFQFLTWTVYQKRYLTPPQYPFDSAFNTYLWDQARANFPQIKRSPIRSQVKFAPAQQFSLDWLEEYDVNHKKVTRLDLGMGIQGPLGNLHGTWSRSPARIDQDTQQVLYSEQNALSVNSNLSFGKTLQLGGSADYSLVNQSYLNTPIFPKGFVSYSGSVKFDFQCLGLKFIYTRRVTGLLSDGTRNYYGSFQFAIELAHIGTFGMGPGGTAMGGAGLGGLR